MIQNLHPADGKTPADRIYYENIYRNTPGSTGHLPFLYSAAKPLHQDPTDNLEIPRWHEQVEIKLFLHGKAEIICGPHLFIAEEGDVVVINSGVLHGIRQYGDTEPVYHLLMVSLDQLAAEKGGQALVPVLEGRVSFRSLIRGDTELQETFRRLFQELEQQKAGWELAAMGHLAVLLTHLLRIPESGSQFITPENRQYIDKIQPAIVYIQKNYRQSIRVDNLAAAWSLSPWHFSRLFRKATGYTPVDYLNRFRMQKAAAMLEIDGIPVTDIAYSVGFNDEAYFSRCFKNYMQLSPNKYREQILRSGKEQDSPSERQNSACTTDI